MTRASIPLESWRSAFFDEPPWGTLVRMKCEITGEQITGYWEDVRPTLAGMNLPYYWWKETGIARTHAGD